MRLPQHLNKAPLLEAIFELRFESRIKGLADLLPGALFTSLQADYPQLEPLPLNNVPREMRQSDPVLHYLPSFQLVGAESRILFGDSMIGVIKTLPYHSWNDFRQRIQSLLDAVKRTNWIGGVERFSLKAVNLLSAPIEGQLELLNLKVEIAGKPVSQTGFRLRTESSNPPYIKILQISTNAVMNESDSPQRSGLLIEVDCIRTLSNEDPWSLLPDEIENLHAQQKEAFFSLLTDKTLASLEPTYGDQR